MTKLTIVLAAVLVLSVVFSASVGAVTVDHTNYVTFSAPVALPGVTLPAGTYMFELPMAAHGSLNVVRVSSRDGGRTYLTAFTNTVRRTTRGSLGARIELGELERGTAPPVKAWFPEGESIGHQFIY